MPNLVGLKLEEAKKIADSNRIIIRIMQEDGVDQIGTCEFRSNRINVAIQNGIISEIISQG